MIRPSKEVIVKVRCHRCKRRIGSYKGESATLLPLDGKVGRVEVVCPKCLNLEEKRREVQTTLAQ